MKSFSFVAAATVVVALVSLALNSPAEAAKKRRWILLGEKVVTDRVDRDIIPVTAKAGTFTAIRLGVTQRAVEFRDLKIHFANGDTKDVELRRVIGAGERSRVIDLPGNKRAIKAIEMLYDAQSILGKTATVKVYGSRGGG